MLPLFSTSTLFYTSLSPLMTPGCDYTSVIVSSTLESDIYTTSEQLGVGATSNNLHDLKNNFMTIRNISGGEKEKSRGAFSPRKVTPFKTRMTDYERL